jgi:hypothetical protein
MKTAPVVAPAQCERPLLASTVSVYPLQPKAKEKKKLRFDLDIIHLFFVAEEVSVTLGP